MRVVVAGAGIGGLTAALALPPDVRVAAVEQAPVLEAAGAGVQLSPNASRILIALGLGEALAAVASEPEAAEVRHGGTGRLLLRQPLGAFARRRWGAPYLHLHRGDLQALLLRAAQARPGFELRLGARLEAVEASEGRAAGRLAGGERLEADAIVGADGLRSRVRRDLWGEGQPRFTGQIAWRGLVEAHRLPEPLRAPGARVWIGPGRHFVHYPVRRGELVNFVGVVARRGERGESWTERGDPAELARDFAGWDAAVGAVIAAAGEVWRWALFDRPPLRRWTRGRVTLLGDAGHPMPPFLAQGAAMAIEDAAALGRAFARPGTVEDRLLAYEAARRERATRVQARSRRNGEIFHLPTALARPLFGAAGLADRLSPSGGAARFDWLYGYGA